MLDQDRIAADIHSKLSSSIDDDIQKMARAAWPRTRTMDARAQCEAPVLNYRWQFSQVKSAACTRQVRKRATLVVFYMWMFAPHLKRSATLGSIAVCIMEYEWGSTHAHASAWRGVPRFMAVNANS